MPRISAFYGITVWMYYEEGAHAVPHFHAGYAGQRASFSVDGRPLAGALPTRATRLVLEWAALHREELLLNWERARRGDTLVSDEPLA